MKNLILLATVALVAASCSDDDGLQDGPSKNNTILFGTSVQVETKAPVTGTNIPDGEKVGIYALTHATTPAWAASGNLMDNVSATSNGSGGLEYSDLKEYTNDNLHNFYAYYPYNASITAPGAKIAPKLTVTLEKTSDAQSDYMYAVPIEKYKRTSEEATAGTIQKLVFKHALTQIRFKFKNTETANKVSIVNIQVKDKDKGTMSITDGTWSDLSATGSDGNTFTFYHPSSLHEVAAGTSEDIPGQLMLFPKTGTEMAANTAGGLEFILNLKNASDLDKSVTITPKVPTAGLEAGKSYLYTLLYSETTKDFISLSAEVTEWVNAEGGNLPVTPTN